MLFCFLQILLCAIANEKEEFYSQFSKFDLVNFSEASVKILYWDNEQKEKHKFFVFSEKYGWSKKPIDDHFIKVFAFVEEIYLILSLNLKSTFVENEEQLHKILLEKIARDDFEIINEVKKVFEAEEIKTISIEEKHLQIEINNKDIKDIIIDNYYKIRPFFSRLIVIQEQLSLDYINNMFTKDFLHKINYEFTFDQTYDFLSIEKDQTGFKNELWDRFFASFYSYYVKVSFNFEMATQKGIPGYKEFSDFEILKYRIKYFCSYEFIKDANFERFINCNRLFNEIKDNNLKKKKKYVNLLKDAKKVTTEQESFYHKTWEEFLKDFDLQMFIKVYEDILDEVKKGFKEYEFILINEIKDVFDVRKITAHCNNKIKSYNLKIDKFAYHFTNKLTLFNHKYINFFNLIKISEKSNLDKEFIKRMFEENQKMINKLAEFGIIVENKGEFHLNYFSNFDLWLGHTFKNVCPFVKDLEKLRNKIRREGYTFDYNSALD